MKVNMKQISEITGVSTATVSNALNNKKGVNANTAARVLKVAYELGYFEESRITKVKFVTFKRDGSVVEDTPFFPLMLTGIEQECRDSGMDMIMCTLDMRDESCREQAKALLNDKSSAVIMLGTEMVDSDIQLLREITTPFIVIDYWNGDMSFNAIKANNEDSVRYAIDYLIRKGHKQIGYLKGRFRIVPFKDRETGYRTGMLKAGLPVEEKYTLEVGTTMDAAYADMKRYLEEKIKLPTAFMADNDMIALGAMKAMAEYGVRIPEEVSVIGFDDLPFSAISSPPLTTLRVPKQEIGRIATRRLIQMIKERQEAGVKIEVSTQFVERGSVKTIK